MIEVILKLTLLVFYTNMAYYWGKRKAEEDNYSAWKKGYEEGVKRRNLQDAFKGFDD